MNKKTIETMNGFDKIKTILGEETNLEGDLKYKDSLMIKGRFKGTIKTDGYLILDANSNVEADITAKYVRIAGTLKGNILDSFKIEMVGQAKVAGNIKTEVLKIDDGVIFEGKCEMKTK
ncbi:MAG: polymer-forming cytoskeletal protein [Spirochaetes bacterium]|nr:polymer-forming cytoskeletal protein [Spirochaetota bacterium]